MRLLVSTAYSSWWKPAELVIGSKSMVIAPRGCDWGKRGVRKYLHHILESLRVLWKARRFDALVLCTVGIEAFVVARLRSLICPRTTLLCFDVLMPKEQSWVGWVKSWLRRCDRFLIIRRGDAPTLETRFGVPLQKCTFVPFPADPSVTPIDSPDEDFVYSGGWAHRDWPTLVQALARLPYRAVIATGSPVSVPPEAQGRITVLPMLSPEDGRKMMAKARVVVVSMSDTKLPSGPLVLLDAMAMGKPVVVTRVNGTVDYARDRDNALTVSPQDADAMAKAIDELMTDQALRKRLAASAHRSAREMFNFDACMRGIAEAASAA